MTTPLNIYILTPEGYHTRTSRATVPINELRWDNSPLTDCTISNLVRYKKYISTKPRIDGFGAQYQTFLYYILYAYHHNLEYAHENIRTMEHNYDNNTNFIKNMNEFMNIENNYTDKSKINSEDIIDIDQNLIYQTVEDNIDIYVSDNPALNKIKRCFWENKNKNHYNNDKFNVAIHVRRPNIHDTRVDGANTSDDYYLSVIAHIREKYKHIKNIQFHIYSQGRIEHFNQYIHEDTVFHINEELRSTFTGLVSADVLVLSRSSFSYIAAFLSEGEIYYINFWHKPKKDWIIL